MWQVDTEKFDTEKLIEMNVVETSWEREMLIEIKVMWGRMREEGGRREEAVEEDGGIPNKKKKRNKSMVFFLDKLWL